MVCFRLLCLFDWHSGVLCRVFTVSAGMGVVVSLDE